MSQRILRCRRGITMIELLVVLAILGFLLAFLLPAVARVRAAGGRAQGMNNMRQVITAVHAFHDVYRKMPPAFDKGGLKFPVSLHVNLLPFVEQDPLFRQFHQAKSSEGIEDVRIPVYIDPLDSSVGRDTVGIQNYAANLRLFSTSGSKSEWNKDIPALNEVEPSMYRLQTIPDGASNTLAFATKIGVCGEGGSKYASGLKTKTAAFFGQNHAQEKASASSAKATFQLAPMGKDCLCSPLMAQSFIKNGIPVAVADGSVRIVSLGVSPESWNSALHPADGNNLGKDFFDE